MTLWRTYVVPGPLAALYGCLDAALEVASALGYGPDWYVEEYARGDGAEAKPDGTQDAMARQIEDLTLDLAARDASLAAVVTCLADALGVPTSAGTAVEMAAQVKRRGVKADRRPRKDGGS